MARKNTVPSFRMIDQGDLSGDITSNITNVENLDKCSIAVSWSGTSPVGTIIVESRNGTKESWNAVEFPTITVSGNTGNHSIVFREMSFTDLRLRYVATSGTGTLDAVYTSKQVGG